MPIFFALLLATHHSCNALPCVTTSAQDTMKDMPTAEHAVDHHPTTQDGRVVEAVEVADFRSKHAAGNDEVKLRNLQVSPSGISQLLGYRFHLGNAQWRVRWHGDENEVESWEVWSVLDTEELRQHATILRSEALRAGTSKK